MSNRPARKKRHHGPAHQSRPTPRTTIGKRLEAPTVLAGPTEHVDDEMTTEEALRILHGSCEAKAVHLVWRDADKAALSLTRNKGVTFTAYQCPFAGILHADKHWHVGHPPTLAQVERLALAMRWFPEHPEDVPGQ